MANVDSAFGLKPYGGLSPSNAYMQSRKYLINPSGYGTTIFQGDLVKFNAGYIEQAGVSDANIVGVFNGVFYQSSDGPVFKNFYPASTNASDITAFVIDDPDAVFLMNADAAFTRADLFKNYSLSSNSGNTTTGVSEAMLDVSASGVATTFAVQAIDISQDPENSDTTTSNANILVRINNHFYRSGTGIA